MRAIWKGAVSFGLVNVPVRLYSATENHDVQFRQVHREDGGRIKYQRVCSIDGEQVSYDDIAKGFETDDGQMVVLTDDDLAQVPVSSSKEIAVDKFVPSSQIDAMLLDKSYFLEPDKGSLKPYVLLRDALRATDRVALVTVSIRTRSTVALLRVRDEVIVLQTMLWPDEIRSADFGVLDEANQIEPKSAELAMAGMLVDSLSGDYDPEDYSDDYEQAVKEVVRAKLDGNEVTALPEQEDEGGEVLDLLAALQQSVNRAKKSRGEPVDEEPKAAAKTEPVKEAPARKVPGRKAAAKKTTTKKATPTKTTSKKATPKNPASKKTASKETAKATTTKPVKKAG